MAKLDFIGYLKRKPTNYIMAKEIERNEAMELYKITRNSVEHFDRLLSNFRAIVLGFNGTIIATVMAFYGRAIVKSSSPYTDKTQVRLLFIGSAVFAFINILIWYLEKHYHRYLTMSAKVAEEIEKKLFKNQKIRLTYQLREIRRCDFCDEAVHKKIRQVISKVSQYIRTYDCLYLIPIVASIFLNVYLANNLRQPDLWIVAKAIVLFSTILSYILIRRSYWVAERCDLASTARSSREEREYKLIEEIRNKRTWLFIGHARMIEFVGLVLIFTAFFPVFNSYYIFLIPLILGIFLFVCGRGMLLQKNWARSNLRWFTVIFAFIMLWTMYQYHKPTEFLILSQSLLVGLCLLDFYYLSRRAINSMLIYR